jgi:Na+/phosphate symporter
MSTTSVLVLLAGEVALLLWGIATLTGAVSRAFGGDLRRVVGRSARSRLRAFAGGVGVTMALQSSTATALMVSSFAGRGIIALAPALAVMLGANVGTAVVAQVVTLDLSLLHAAALTLGLGLLRICRGERTREVGLALIGLGLMLLALRLIDQTMTSVTAADEVRRLFAILADDRLVCLIAAALVAWAAHASLVGVLFALQLSAGGLISPDAALAMVLGANVGAALNPVTDAFDKGPAALRLPVGNLLTRIAGAAVAMPLLGFVPDAIAAVGAAPARLAADFHAVFNVAVAAATLPLVGRLARLLERMLPENAADDDPLRPRHLDLADLPTPAVALSNAAREVLRMADIAEAMLQGSRRVFAADDRDTVAAVHKLDDALDRLYRAVNRYLADVNRGDLGDDEARRLSEILVFAINLEHIGDIIDCGLMDLASKRMRMQLRLADDTLAEIEDIHGRLLDHLNLAVSVFLCGDAAAARRLVAEKERFRDLERAATRRLLERVSEREPSALAALGLELDIVRDLKRVEAHIAATAHALLEATGDLKPTRLSTR